MSGVEAFMVTVESDAVIDPNVIAVVVVAVIETATVSLVSKVVRRVGETVKEPPPVKNVPVGTAARDFENTKRWLVSFPLTTSEKTTKLPLVLIPRGACQGPAGRL